MPEVMEIRKYADFINQFFKNKKLTDIKIINGRYKKHESFDLYNTFKKALPLKLLLVKTKGKFIYFEFEKNYFLLNTLGLSGGWAFQKTDTQFEMPKLLEYVEKEKIEVYLLRSTKHINVEFIFGKEKLVFFDMLSFGTLKVIDNKENLLKKLNTIGEDIMDVSYDVFKNKIMKEENKKIGIVLLNQKIISGIGNYIRADALWLAEINPFKLIKNMTENEFKKLYHSLKIITWGNYDRKHGIKNKIINKTDKIPHDYKRDFFVYREKTDIYGNPVIKEELYEGSQKRFIYWVKKIEK